MSEFVDFDELTYMIMEKAGYSRNDLRKPHDSMIVGSKKFSKDSIVFQGEVKEQDFYSEHFQISKYYEGEHNAKWQCLFVKYHSRTAKVEESDHSTTLELREDKKHFEKVEIRNMTVDQLTLQICGLLGIIEIIQPCSSQTMPYHTES